MPIALPSSPLESISRSIAPIPPGWIRLPLRRLPIPRIPVRIRSPPPPPHHLRRRHGLGAERRRRRIFLQRDLARDQGRSSAGTFPHRWPQSRPPRSEVGLEFEF